MIIEHHNSIAIITQEKTSLKEFSTKFSVLYERFKEDDIVLNLKDISVGSLDLLVSISKQHRLLNHSFVVVTTQLNQDDFEDDFIIVPTLQEAKDFIEMDLLSRDLGI
mgnify:CR=1 FL=1